MKFLKNRLVMIGAAMVTLFAMVMVVLGQDTSSTEAAMWGARTILWGVFGVIIVGFLVVDLGWLNRQAHKVSIKSATYQSLFWVAIALGYAALIWSYVDHSLAADFITAYLTEKMLSVDNLFVIMLIFAFFKIPDKYHHRVLFWGILGAVVFRAIFIIAGSALVAQFHWVLYFFGAFLIYTAYKIIWGGGDDDEEQDFEQKRTMKLIKRYLPFSFNHHGHFFIKENGKWHVTLLFAVLMLVETTDIVFAVDSIPAVFAISQDALIIFTSNIFAVMGLRALFFLVEGILKKFHHMDKGVALVLAFIGGKMLVDIFGVHISSPISLGIIVLLLGGSLIASRIFPPKEGEDELFEEIENNQVPEHTYPAAGDAAEREEAA